MEITYASWALVLFFFICAWLSFEALAGEPKRTALRPIPIDYRRRARSRRR
jgi:hypothetical protein